MKFAELKTKNNDELLTLLLDRKKELMNLRFQKVSGTLSNTSRFSIIRKDIARIMTKLNSNKQN